MSTVSKIRTYDLPTLERKSRILGKESFRNLGYQVGCANHCTTTAFLGGKDTMFFEYKGLREIGLAVGETDRSSYGGALVRLREAGDLIA